MQRQFQTSETVVTQSEGNKPRIRRLKLIRRKKVTWTEDTIDNSNLNKKSSKICCIFHREGIDDPQDDKNKYERV